MNTRRRKRLLRFVLRKALAICMLAVLIAGIARCMSPQVSVAATSTDPEPVAEAPKITVYAPEPATAELMCVVMDATPKTPQPAREEWEPSEEDVTYLAKTLYGECRGVPDKAQQTAVAWCILNRVSSPRFKGDTVREIVTAPYQFAGYSSSFPVTDELKELAIDVLKRWHAEYCGLAEDVGRTLPADYYFFHGDGKRNYFRREYNDKDYWNWSLKDPYEGGA